MSSVLIYHNPRCSKSRETFALLEANDIEFDVVLYLKTGLTEQVVEHLQASLGLESIKNMMRQKEKEYAALSLEHASEATLMRALVAHPKLLERPIVIKDSVAKIGRPPENVLDIFS
jgi:arsenate reductase